MTIRSARPRALVGDVGLSAESTRFLVVGAFVVFSFGLIVLLTQSFDTPAVLAALLLCLAVAFLAIWPEVATVAVVFILYTNLPALAVRQGVPVLVASSFILLLALPLLHFTIAKRQALRSDTALGLMLLFLMVLLLSAFGARNTAAAIESIQGFVLEGIVLYWLVINVIRDGSSIRRVIWTLLVAGGLLGGLTLYQEVTGSYRQQFGGLVQRNYEYLELRKRADDSPELRERLKLLAAQGQSSRPGGPVSQPNRFAQILLVLLPLAVFMNRSGRSRAARLSAALLGGLIVAGVILTSSRGAFLNLVLLTVALMYLKWLRPTRILLLGLLLAIVTAAVTPNFFQRVQSITRVTHLFSNDPAEQKKADGAIRGRVTTMLAAWQVFRDNPVLGVGAGQFTQYVQEYSRNLDTKYRDINTPRRAHNLYLEMAADVGVLGLTAFLSIIGWLIVRLWRARQFWLDKDAAAADLATACCLCLIAYLGTGMFAHLSYERYYWFLLAVAGASLHVLASSARAELRGRPTNQLAGQATR